MMFWVILSLLCATSNSATLGNSYLPPPNAKDAGGNEDDLEVPLEPPYIDPYSDNRHLVPEEARYNFGYGPRNEFPHGIEPEDQTRDFSDGFIKYPGRFLYGSYSYEGSDNVVVTVTYTSERKKSKNKRTQCDYSCDYNRSGLQFDNDFGLFVNGVVPTPPSLPRELQRAFAFHRKTSPEHKRKENTRGEQSKNEERGEKSIIHGGYSFRNAPPINHSVNNVQVN